MKSSIQGEEGEGESPGEGVVIPEEFQQQAHKLLSRADKHQLNHVSDRVSARREELMAEEREKESQQKGGPKGKNVPATMSAEGMPSEY